VLLRLVRMPPRCGCRPSGDEGEPVVQHDSMPEEQEEHADADMALSMALRCDGVLGRCAGRLERDVGVAEGVRDGLAVRRGEEACPERDRAEADADSEEEEEEEKEEEEAAAAEEEAEVAFDTAPKEVGDAVCGASDRR
jgi:hypothetical protein